MQSFRHHDEHLITTEHPRAGAVHCPCIRVPADALGDECRSCVSTGLSRKIRGRTAHHSFRSLLETWPVTSMTKCCLTPSFLTGAQTRVSCGTTTLGGPKDMVLWHSSEVLLSLLWSLPSRSIWSLLSNQRCKDVLRSWFHQLCA